MKDITLEVTGNKSGCHETNSRVRKFYCRAVPLPCSDAYRSRSLDQKSEDIYEPPPSRIVPAGEYEMGDHHDGMSSALPVHIVYVDEFAIDQFEVTNIEFCTYLNFAIRKGLIDVVNGVVYKKNDTEAYCDTRESNDYSRITWNGETFGVVALKQEHPMTMVSWYGAAAFANWRSTKVGLTPCYFRTP